MNKIYKGYELLKAIEENKIEIGTRFKLNGYSNRTIIYKGGDSIRYADDDTEVDNCFFINTEFELIEDEVNIDSIEELHKRDKDYIRQDVYEIIKNNREAIIELQKAVKQLNKEIKSIKEK